MTAFKWNDRYITSIATIDSQHRKLFDIANELYVCIKAHKSSAEIGEVGNKLLDYTNYHFTFEESQMEKTNFFELSQHKQLHDLFRVKVDQFIGDVRAGKSESLLEMLDFLIEWLVDHILIKDKKYVPDFKNNNIS